MPKKKVPATQADELFEFKTMLVKESVKKSIMVHDFTQKIEDANATVAMYSPSGSICSPKFEVAGAEFCFFVLPDTLGYIGVYLDNLSKEDQMCSVSVKLASGVERSLKMKKIPSGEGSVYPKFLSHEKYREWAKTHGDVLKLEVTVTVYRKPEGDGWIRTKLIPEPSSQETLSTFGKAILDDVDTSDFSVRCNTKNFQVHKAVLCSRSPVFRSSILTPMLEAARGEIFVQDLGEKALGTILNYVYTGELELGEDSDILELAWGGNKYLLPGFMELLGYRLQMMKEELTGRMIADLLIAAHRHGAEDLRKIALVRIRADKEIISDEAFRKQMSQADPSIMMDIVKDL